MSVAIAPLFSQTYLVVDYGSTTIKGILYRKSPLGEDVLRAELLAVIPLQKELEIASKETNRLLLEQGAERGGQKKADIKEATPAVPVSTEEENYEYNLVRYIQSFFPGENNFIMNIPLEKTIVRDVTIPNIKGRQPAEIIPVEVESLLYLPLEEVEVIGQPWASDEEQLRVISFTVRHADLQKRVQPLLYAQSALQMLSVEAAGLAGFIKLLGPQFYQGRTVAQLDIGGEGTIFNVLEDGQLAFTRQIYIGGEEISAIIGRVLRLELPQAEQKKLELRLDLNRQRGDKVSETFLKRNKIGKRDYLQILQESHEAIEQIGMEVSRSLIALPCRPPETFYLSGGGSLLKGVREILAAQLQQPLESYPADLNTNQPLELWITALGTGAHYLSGKNRRFDFLETPFGKMLRGGRLNLSAFIMPLLFVGLSITGLLIAFLFEIFHDRRQIEGYQDGILKIAETIPSLTAKDSTESILAEAEKICRRSLQNSQTSNISALEILKDISQTIPPSGEIELKFRRFRFDEAGGAEMEVEVANLSEANVVEQKLNENRRYSSIEVKSRKLLPPKQQVRLRLQLTLQEDKSRDGNNCL